MVFQKNRFLANTCIFASVLITAILGALLILPFTVKTSDSALSFFVISCSILAVFNLLYTVIIALDNKSTVIVSEDGIEIKSRVKKQRYMNIFICVCNRITFL